MGRESGEFATPALARTKSTSWLAHVTTVEHHEQSAGDRGLGDSLLEGDVAEVQRRDISALMTASAAFIETGRAWGPCRAR